MELLFKKLEDNYRNKGKMWQENVLNNGDFYVRHEHKPKQQR